MGEQLFDTVLKAISAFSLKLSASAKEVAEAAEFYL